jgi:hypothetical protein
MHHPGHVMPRECGLVPCRCLTFELEGEMNRHCERRVRRSSKSEGGSEAIHRAAWGRMDCFVAVAPRNDGRSW